MRAKRAALMEDGVRFAGLEELLLTLDAIYAAWQADPNLKRIAFLVERAIADFETAVEAGLSGYPAVATDAMRDVMEIELLLLDFFGAPQQVEVWLTADRATRLKVFRPADLRSRLIDIGLHKALQTERVESDYRMHSEVLHVNPALPPLPFLARGHVSADDVMTFDSSFIEIFEHARRLGNALLLVANRLSPSSEAARACRGPLPAFELAYERTQEIVGQFFGALQVLADEDASVPASSE